MDDGSTNVSSYIAQYTILKTQNICSLLHKSIWECFVQVWLMGAASVQYNMTIGVCDGSIYTCLLLVDAEYEQVMYLRNLVPSLQNLVP